MKAHHYAIPPADGKDSSLGVCLYCGDEKEFCNIPPEDILGIELKSLPTQEELELCLPSEVDLCLSASLS